MDTTPDRFKEQTPEVRPTPRTRLGQFLPGVAPPGRPKGSKNKLPPAVDTALRMGMDPVEVMLHVVKYGTMQDPDGTEQPVEMDERMRLLREVAPYLHSKAPTETHNINDTRSMHVDLTELMRDPAMVAAAEKLALGMLGDSTPAPVVFDAEAEEIA